MCHQVGRQSRRHLVEGPRRQGHIQGLSLIRITPLIWIKILEAPRLTAFNHFDGPLKRALPPTTPHPLTTNPPTPPHTPSPILLYAPTVEGELPLHRVHPSGVLGHALVRPRVLLLEVGDLQDAAGLPGVHLPGEGRAVHPPPADGRHRAAETTDRG